MKGTATVAACHAIGTPSERGLALNMLGAFPEGSQEVSYAPLAGGILRQVFLHDGRIAGGALVGDISGAGPIHHRMINGKDSAQEISGTIKPSFGLLPRSLPDHGIERRRARLIPG